MTPIEFLINSLKELVKKIPQIKSYSVLDEEINTYVIKIIPQDIFHNDIEYAKLEMEITNNFYKSFLETGIVFVSEDWQFEEIKGGIEIKGTKYQEQFPVSYNGKIDSYVNTTVNNTCGVVLVNQPTFKTSFDLSNFVNNIKSLNSKPILGMSLEISNGLTGLSKDLNGLKVNLESFTQAA